MLAMLLIVGGLLALIYGGFSYTKNTQEAKIGPLELTVRDTKTVNIPVWAGIATLAIGASLLLVRR
jgi:TRAP-type C4-dicarboxylate transport system permease small subunit